MKRILTVVAILGLAWGSVQAQDVELREDHPREYVVQEGDTLWDIASRFLTRPWQWPAIWQANPQIDNPHLIYPGDVISLEFVGGQPRLTMNPDDSIRRLSPEIRREDISGPISTIPYDAIEPFLRNPRIVTAEELDGLPYVVANYDQRMTASAGDRTYVRGMEDAQVGQEVILARLTYQFEDRSGGEAQQRLRRNRMGRGDAQVPADVRPASPLWRSTFGQMERFNYPIIGYELWESARARVVHVGDPTTLEIISGRREVSEGDYVLPIDYHVYDANFFPRAMDEMPEDARVLSVSEAYHGVGHYQIVAISMGQADGIQAGHTFSVFRPGETIRDEQRYPLMSRAAWKESDRRFVTLPDEYAGHVMVFRPFEHISYAIVLDGGREIMVEDRLDHPDRTP
ncbi:LysM peptidoglycan-binding domain-containing protein [Wenzhouxiangella marina]|uniref:Uncharacterized protein n=1 Tax=Wenzhouxiangella marina TaxID=1579979 RepID=A0A0K0XSS7_9GAMM|nr:LysM domain-containing protein [Wenzhouxiangella marina]AKS40700.1 hypothetical protein WM2015_315 [Wenzhouxiangella marina]MBB6088471.1 hypothetical protein [Wenzhouxiangella marina]